METFNYIEEANVTMSDNFHRELVSQQALLISLEEAIIALQRLDKIKKALFYGRQPQGSFYNFNENDIQVNRLHNDPQAGINLLHAVIGMATEAGELLEALQNGLSGAGFDVTNVFEEIGDNQWYAAAALRVAGRTFDDCHKVNIAKLRARFPNKFTEFDANNRNLEQERAILEQQG